MGVHHPKPGLAKVKAGSFSDEGRSEWLYVSVSIFVLKILSKHSTRSSPDTRLEFTLQFENLLQLLLQSPFFPRLSFILDFLVRSLDTNQLLQPIFSMEQ